MKYMILIYSNPTNWEHPLFLQHGDRSPDVKDAEMKEFVELMTEISQSGELGDTHALADPALTKTIRPDGESLASTDGPFAEAKEQLAGYFVIECDSIDRAVEIASRFPDTRYGATEVRPIM